MNREYQNYKSFDPNNVTFALGADRQGKPTVHMAYSGREVGIVTPACVTNWPRVTGDGNFGTMWGPQDIQKAKFTLDLTDTPIGNATSDDGTGFKWLATLLEGVDDKLLDFVQNNQLKILGRKNLSRDEVKMLQIRSVRAKYDKASGACVGHTVQTSASKFAYDGMGGKFPRQITICDCSGAVIPNGNVAPGDVVAATIYANQVYTGVGGDKFGIHWSFEDIQIVCQRTQMAQKQSVASFTEVYDFAKPYQDPMAATTDLQAQFSEPMVAA